MNELLSAKQADGWGSPGFWQRIRRCRQLTFFLKMRQDFIDHLLILDKGNDLDQLIMSLPPSPHPVEVFRCAQLSISMCNTRFKR